MVAKTNQEILKDFSLVVDECFDFLSEKYAEACQIFGYDAAYFSMLGFIENFSTSNKGERLDE